MDLWHCNGAMKCVTLVDLDRLDLCWSSPIGSPLRSGLDQSMSMSLSMPAGRTLTTPSKTTLGVTEVTNAIERRIILELHTFVNQICCILFVFYFRIRISHRISQIRIRSSDSSQIYSFDSRNLYKEGQPRLDTNLTYSNEIFLWWLQWRAQSWFITTLWWSKSPYSQLLTKYLTKWGPS